MPRKSPFRHHRYSRDILLSAVRWYLRRASVDWHVDESYIRVGGKWRYLWRAVDTNGQMVDFRLTATRDAKAAKAFLTGRSTAPGTSTASGATI